MTQKLREDALAGLMAGVRAVEPGYLVRGALEDFPDSSVRLLAIGKGALAMASAACDVLQQRIVNGLVVTPHGVNNEHSLPSRVEVLYGGHPIPTAEGVITAQRVREYAESASTEETVLCLISGGGSALMTLPVEGVSLEDMQWVTSSLLRAGASIQQLNCVRKHLDQLKGGRLAELCAPARVRALVLSDVIGDPLDVISSGPTVPDPTTFDDAVKILQGFALWDQAPDAVRSYLESGLRGEAPESPKSLDNVQVDVIGSNRIAAAAALSELQARGYTGAIITTELTGEARTVGKDLARQAAQLSSKQCSVFAGETTVTVTGTGKGGRNQELVLSAALELNENQATAVVASIGTDGIDGPTDAAGGIADRETITRGQSSGLDAHHALGNNDAYTFLKASGDLIITGATGTNVMDLQVIIA